ncbi:helix-turn-helix domain-containing protein [Paenibacillus mesophilus]|uniref:helix-turn-helix domain-containing protein n=1 Tax=Paenibacillus mesophilus TaxID=2582849 RepID=UPI00110D9607|nr:helix-turn-helix domain-containing protein [Paenibacillus mesophilus]TMV47868.1 helix-turn-helix domain-containing protein [Paenibacillus mesophilus]
MERCSESNIQFDFGNRGKMRVHSVEDGCFRIRLDQTGRFAETPLVRQGILQFPESSDRHVIHHIPGERITVMSGQVQLEIDSADGSFRIIKQDGEEIVRSAGGPQVGEPGFGVHFSLLEDEAFYGLGNTAPESIQRRGLKATIRVEDNLWASAPIPFLMSSRGWAVLMNTALPHTFDIGNERRDRLSIEGAEGELDFFLFTGGSFAELLEKYTNVSGKPQLLPIWMYGLNFISREQADAREVLDDAIKFRHTSLPCDLISLGKDWLEDDASSAKQWSRSRVTDVLRQENKQITIIGILRRQGFKIGVTLSLDCDPTLTACYDLLHKLVEDGVSAFAVSYKSPLGMCPDKIWQNGMHSRELQNLFPLLFAKHLAKGFSNQTNARPVIQIERGYTGMQQFITTTTGVFENNHKAIVALLNYGLAGQTNVSTNMRVTSREGIHSGFLLPWSRVNSFGHFQHPDFLEPPLRRLFQTYARVRYRLLPYLYSTAYTATRTGMPIARAMPLAFPTDPACRDLSQQYMLGDFLLVAVFTNKVYLPEGQWIDYWNGNRYKGLQSIEYEIPDGAGGPLFLRAGTIIPMWPQMDHTGQIEVQTISWHIYPHGRSEFTLYEDDGATLHYQEGKIAVTHMKCETQLGHTSIQISRRSGSYADMPITRDHELIVHMEIKPESVTMNGNWLPDLTKRAKTVPHRGWRYDRLTGTVLIKVAEADTNERSTEIEFTYLAKPASTFRHNSSANYRKGNDFWKVLKEALSSLESSVTMSALEKWWSADNKNNSWFLNWMNASHIMIHHIERNGWTAEDVFGEAKNKLFVAPELDSPEKALQLLLQMANQIVYYGKQRQTVKHPAVREIVSIIEQELDGDLSLSSMAERFAMHPSHLSRLFKSETGQAYSDYVMAKRMSRARMYLEEGLNVHEAAGMNGFKDPANFSKAFSKFWGVPPIEFKKKKL